MFDVKSTLGRARFFEGIDVLNLQRLADLSLQKKSKKKTFLFHEGDPGRSIFLLVQGKVQLHKTSQGGKEMVLRLIKPGEVFAEVILFEETCYPVTAVAVVDSIVLELPREKVLKLLDDKTFRNDFIRMLFKKQRYLATKLHHLASPNLEERLFHFLAEQYDAKETIQTTLSKKDTAAAIGITPETLSRLLLSLKKRGIMVWEGNEIRFARLISQDRSN